MQATVRNIMAKDTMGMGKGMDMMVMVKVTMVAAAVVTEMVMGMTRMAMDTQKAMDIRMATAPRQWTLMQKLKGMAMTLMEKAMGMTRAKAMMEAAVEKIMEMVMRILVDMVEEMAMGMKRMAMAHRNPWMLMERLKAMAMKLMEKVTGMTRARAMTEAAAEAIMEMVMDMTKAMEMVTLVTPKAV